LAAGAEKSDPLPKSKSKTSILLFKVYSCDPRNLGEEKVAFPKISTAAKAEGFRDRT
jgi:hypothetical protein